MKDIEQKRSRVGWNALFFPNSIVDETTLKLSALYFDKLFVFDYANWYTRPFLINRYEHSKYDSSVDGEYETSQDSDSFFFDILQLIDEEMVERIPLDKEQNFLSAVFEQEFLKHFNNMRRSRYSDEEGTEPSRYERKSGWPVPNPFPNIDKFFSDENFVNLFVLLNALPHMAISFSKHYQAYLFPTHQYYQDFLTNYYLPNIGFGSDLLQDYKHGAIWKASELALETFSLEIPEAAFASIDDLLEVRYQLRDELERFRNILLSLSMEIESEPYSIEFAEDMQRIIMHRIRPRIQELNEIIKTSENKVLQRTFKNFRSLGSTVTLIGTIFIGVDPVLAASISAFISMLDAVFETKIETREKIWNNGLMFMLKTKNIFRKISI